MQKSDTLVSSCWLPSLKVLQLHSQLAVFWISVSFVKQTSCFSSLYLQFFLREDRVASWVTDLADNQFADLLQQVYGKVLYLSVEEVLLFLAERRGYSVMLLTTLAVVLRVMLPVCDPLLAIT